MTDSSSQPIGPLLVVGAHAFDAEVIAGALAALWHRRGGTAVLVHVSLGERGHHTKTAQEYARQKRDEALAAAALLGAEARFLEQPDTEPAGVSAVGEQIAAVVRDVRPATVVTHWRGSWHPDHVATHQATMRGLLLGGLGAAAEPRRAHAPRELLFGENWEDLDDFRPDTYLDVTEAFDAWQAALDAYEIGRIPAPGFPYRDYYTSLARMRGCVIGTGYAEAFLSAPVETRAGLGLALRDRWQAAQGSGSP
ncbi:MAG TPA: PIG-L family deacetylase [Acidimicrobiales bacterium]|nr:PIG-L family deacetylase [Acidimicrobiales bacterium]